MKFHEEKSAIILFGQSFKLNLFCSFGLDCLYYVLQWFSIPVLAYRCSLVPYAVSRALWTEHVRSFQIEISLMMAEYPCEVHFAEHLRSNWANLWTDKRCMQNVQSGRVRGTELRTTDVVDVYCMENMFKPLTFSVLMSVIVLPTLPCQNRLISLTLDSKLIMFLWVYSHHLLCFFIESMLLIWCDVQLTNCTDAKNKQELSMSLTGRMMSQ